MLWEERTSLTMIPQTQTSCISSGYIEEMHYPYEDQTLWQSTAILETEVKRGVQITSYNSCNVEPPNTLCINQELRCNRDYNSTLNPSSASGSNQNIHYLDSSPFRSTLSIPPSPSYSSSSSYSNDKFPDSVDRLLLSPQMSQGPPQNPLHRVTQSAGEAYYNTSLHYDCTTSPPPAEHAVSMIHCPANTQNQTPPPYPTPYNEQLPEVKEERPTQRLRTDLRPATSAESFSSPSRGSSNSPQLRRGSASRSRRGSRDSLSSRPGSSRKGRKKQVSDMSPPQSQASFGTFMVNPSPAIYEPIGATYMSTVNFQSDPTTEVFEHGPTDLPPRPYIGGPDAISPWKPRKNLGTIPGSALDYLPVLEERIDRLENALGSYLDLRSRQSIRNSILPGSDS